MAGPLTGVKILDLTTVVMGPFATQILAELGAEVTKVESLEGDNMRDVGPMQSKSMGHLHLQLNRGKRSIAIDLKQPDGRDVVTRLLAEMDVLVFNIRPQAMARLGLSYKDVKSVNPRLIYVGAYGYSERGERAGRAAYDDLIQGSVGVPWLLSRDGADPPRYAPLNFADRVTGLHIVYAVTAALYYREKTGQGQSVEVPMFEAVSHFVLGDHLAGLSYRPPKGGPGYERLRHRRPYQTKDGYLCVLVYNQGQWERFFDAIGRPEMMSDPRFATHAMRATHVDKIYDLLAGLMKERTSADWMELLDKADIPVARMNTVNDLLSDAHLRSSGFFIEEEHPSEGPLYAPRTPTGWSESAPEPRTPAPRLGEHSLQVLTELGYTRDEIARLKANNIVKGA
ncbi:MAG: CoA transferase [Burkholderiales bacterium]|nr:CoA transferase [Burkholderiales bacterium]